MPPRTAGVTTVPATIGVQPAFVSDLGEDRLIAFDVNLFNLSPEPTNYVGCVRASSIPSAPSNAHPRMVMMARYGGVFRSRHGLKMQKVRDGTSNTVMIGEAIGFIHNRVRSGRQAWFFGGLARARSAIEWGESNSLAMPGLELIGDSFYAYPVGFGSMHPTSANFAHVDGSVVDISRQIDWKTLYSLCGINDQPGS